MGKAKDIIIPFALILLIGILIMLAFKYIGNNPSKKDCVIGRDSSDCLEDGGGGHPLWNN